MEYYIDRSAIIGNAAEIHEDGMKKVSVRDSGIILTKTIAILGAMLEDGCE